MGVNRAPLYAQLPAQGLDPGRCSSKGQMRERKDEVRGARGAIFFLPGKTGDDRSPPPTYPGWARYYLVNHLTKLYRASIPSEAPC